MGFNIFLYCFIIWALLVGKSFDYKPSDKHEDNEKS